VNTITVSKRDIFILATTSIIVVLGIFALQILLPAKKQPQVTSSSSDDDTAAAFVATTAVKNFFTVDYHEGKDTWLKRICAVSTTSGCQLLSKGLDPMWERINTSRSVITVRVATNEKAADNPPEQVWITTIVLSAPLPGSNKTKDQAYILVEKTEEGWKFDRFLIAREIQALQERQNMNGDKTQAEKTN
jgi:hypothetical protein